MVEFGLKLSDNKVAEWGEFYLRYEVLKQILNKCKNQYKRFRELSKKDPEMADALLRLKKQGTLASTPLQLSEDLQRLRSPGNNPSPLTGSQTTTTASTHSHQKNKGHRKGGNEPSSEQSLLLEKSEGQEKNASYGNQISFGSHHSSNSLALAFGVTSIFSQSWERQLKNSLLQLEKYGAEFEKLLVQDIDSVNAFYNEKLVELEHRLNFLKETVISMNGAAAKKPRATSIRLEDEEAAGLSKEEIIDAPLVDPHSKHHRGTNGTMEVARSFARMTLLKEQKHSHIPSGASQQHLGASLWSVSSAAALVTLDEDGDVEGEHMEEEGDNGHEMKLKGEAKAKRIRETQSIQRAVVDQYRTAKLLHNYAIMNYTGFVKIVKKHDKVIPMDKGKYKQAIRASRICNEGKEVEEHEAKLEKHYAVWFCGGNRSEARAQLLPKKGDSLEMDWSQLRLGYRMGMCTILGLWVCWDCIWGYFARGTTSIGERTAFPVFRGVGGLLTLQWFWGLSTWVWSRYRINYIYLFDFNPRIVESPLKIFNDAVDNTLFFLICMLLYYKAGAHDIPGDGIPPGLFPLVLVIYTIVQLILPIRRRGPMWISIGKLITAPLSSPSFYHGYVGDIFTSMVKVFQDLAWTFFFVFTGDWMLSEDTPSKLKHEWSRSMYYKHVLIPLLTLLPLWFRFNQCLRRYADTGDRFPHLANAFKYALSQTVTLFGAFHPLYNLHSHRDSDVFQSFWMSVFVGSSLYSFFWDVYMDWGLGRPQYNFLGPRLMYPKKGFYYAIIGLDLVLRFAWVLTLIPPDTGAKFALPGYLTAVSMALELYRRTVWGFLRLENEHRSNTQGYRRVGFVPLHFSTGHVHQYKQEKEHKGFSVLLEVAIMTAAVICLSFASVIAAQQATMRSGSVVREL